MDKNELKESLGKTICEELAYGSNIYNANQYIKIFYGRDVMIEVSPAIYKSQKGSSRKDAKQVIDSIIERAIKRWSIENGLNSKMGKK